MSGVADKLKLVVTPVGWRSDQSGAASWGIFSSFHDEARAGTISAEAQLQTVGQSILRWQRC